MKKLQQQARAQIAAEKNAAGAEAAATSAAEQGIRLALRQAEAAVVAATQAVARR